MKDEYGQWLWETTTWHDNTGNTTVNPLYEAGLKSFDKTEQEEFVDNLNVNWYVTPHLQLKGQVSVIKSGSEHEKSWIRNPDIILDHCLIVMFLPGSYTRHQEMNYHGMLMYLQHIIIF